MRRVLLCSLLLCALAALPLAAKEREGVVAPPTIAVAGQQLHLMGMGLRKKLWFKVYIASLYLQQPSEDPAQVIAADDVKRVEMHMLRDLERGKIVEAVQEGFERNAGPDLPRLQQRLDSFLRVIPDLRAGQTIVITYLPGRGTFIKAGANAEVSIPGKDFADALFSVWLGRNPVDGDLKEEMLKDR